MCSCPRPKRSRDGAPHGRPERGPAVAAAARLARRGDAAAGDAGQAAGAPEKLRQSSTPDPVRICSRIEIGKNLEFGTVGTKLASVGLSVFPRSKTCDGCKSCPG